MKAKETIKRLLWVDALRGFAIVLMVIFHFCYDLHHFGYVNWNVPNGPSWWPFRYVILMLFIFTSGVSLYLAHRNSINKKKFIVRLIQISGSAVLISLVSMWLFPNSWIYFGILHFIAVASLLGLPLVGVPKLTLLLGVSLLIGYWLGWLHSTWPFGHFVSLLPVSTEDFVPIFPWLRMYLGVGMSAVFSVKTLDLPPLKSISILAKMGKHSLAIYLTHQPILFAGFYLAKSLGSLRIILN